MPRPKYPSDDARRRQRPHVKVHLSIANHPTYGAVFADPVLRGVVVGIWVIAARAHVSATNDELTMTPADVLWITGKDRMVDGAKLLRRACEAAAYCLRISCDRHATCVRSTCQRPARWVVHVRNFARKQGFTPQTPAETPRSSAASEEPKNQGTDIKHSAESRSGGEPASDDAFEMAWNFFPKRYGGNPKIKALKAWRARIEAGVPPQEIIDGTARYAKFIRATGKEGTEFVQQAATFFGPNQNWKELWETPPDHGNGVSGHTEPIEIKDLGDGFVEVDGRRMDRQTAERRYGKTAI